MTNCIHEWKFANQTEHLFCVKCEATMDGKDIIGRLNMFERYPANERALYAELQSQLASTKARLAEYEVGFDPAKKLPKDFEIVYIETEREWKVSRLYPSAIPGSIGRRCFEDVNGKQDEIKDVLRWFPLPGKGGVE